MSTLSRPANNSHDASISFSNHLAQVTTFVIILICHKTFDIAKFPKIACTRVVKTIALNMYKN